MMNQTQRGFVDAKGLKHSGIMEKFTITGDSW